MGDRFYPDRFLQKTLPKSFYSQNLIGKDFSMKKGLLKAMNYARVATGRPIDATVYNVLSQYKQKYKDLISEDDLSKGEAFKEAVNDTALLRQRVEQVVIYDEVQRLKTAHQGEYYRWLPSSAQKPDPLHALLYGTLRRVGQGDKDGNMPGERWGCRCGIEWVEEWEGKREQILKHLPATFVNDVTRMFNDALEKKNLDDTSQYITFGKIEGRYRKRLLRDTDVDFKNFYFQLRTKDMRHSKNHADVEKETSLNQRPVEAKDYALIPYITRYYDKAILQRRKGGIRVKFIKRIVQKYIYVVTKTNPEKKGAFLINKTMFIEK